MQFTTIQFTSLLPLRQSLLLTNMRFSLIGIIFGRAPVITINGCMFRRYLNKPFSVVLQ